MRKLLIASGAYCSSDLVSEFGLIPPAFLPIGNKRLYEHQINWAIESNYKDISISLPLGFRLSPYDIDFFDKMNVQIVFVPVDKNLGESLAYSLLFCSNLDKETSILYGDSFYTEPLSISGNTIIVSKNEGLYERAVIFKSSENTVIKNSVETEDDLDVISGLFHFTSPTDLLRSLHQASFNFIDALNLYTSSNQTAFKKVENWLDFGHHLSFYQSRRKVTTQRAFNGLKICQKTVKKYSHNKKKMLAEYEWFKTVPADIKIFCPNIYNLIENEKIAEYTSEYLYSVSLSDIAVFSHHSSSTWKVIFKEIKKLHLCLSKHKCTEAIESDIKRLYLEKTLSRLNKVSEEANIDISKTAFKYDGKKAGTLVNIAKETAKYISSPKEDDVTIVHGDFCFSNIMYDFRSRNIKVIDPRGMWADDCRSIYGDKRYDIAKLSHSVHGLYDFIMAGRYKLTKSANYNYNLEIYDSEKMKSIQEMFDSCFQLERKESIEIKAIVVQLFLSMLPLHSDDKNRQEALLANALRLYVDFKREIGEHP